MASLRIELLPAAPYRRRSGDPVCLHDVMRFYALLLVLLAVGPLSSATARTQDPAATTPDVAGLLDQALGHLNERRYAQAAECLRLAGDDATARFLLGRMNELGSFGEPDTAAAIAHYQVAAAGRCPQAARALVGLVDDGSDQPAVRAEVRRWLESLCVMGDDVAALELARELVSPGPWADPGLALAWTRIARAQGVEGAAQLEAELLERFSNSAKRAEQKQRQLERELRRRRKDQPGLVQVQVADEVFLPEGAQPPAQAALETAYAAYEARDYHRALRGFAPLAESGSAAAAFYVARIHEMGYVGERNGTLARRWYLAAAQGGVDVAMVNLGLMLSNGRGLARDPALATDLFLRAAYAGNLAGALSLGTAYRTGEGREQDRVEAFAWCSLALELGQAGAQRELEQVEVALDASGRARAAARLQELRGELAGVVPPQRPLPALPEPGSPADREPPPEPEPSGSVPLEPPANPLSRPDPSPQADVAPDPGTRTRLPSMEQAMAALNRGERDEARRILELRAETGDREAMNALAMLLTETDAAAARDWLEKAYLAGDASAAFGIAVLHFEGRLESSSLIEAGAWLTQAAGAGNAEARELLGGLEREFSAEERAAITRRAKELPKPDAAPPLRGGLGAVFGSGSLRSERVQVGALPPGALRLNTTRLVDPLFDGLESHSLLVPEGWMLEGGPSWKPQNTSAFVSVDARVTAPGGEQVLYLPDGSFTHFEASPGGDAPRAGDTLEGKTFLAPGQGPAAFVTDVVLPAYRPLCRDVQVVDLTEMVEPVEPYRELVGSLLGEGSLQLSCPRIRVRYEEDGRVFEEQFRFLYARAEAVQELESGALQTSTDWAVFDVRSLRAPAEQLEASLPLLHSIASSLRPTLAWHALVAEIQQSVLGDASLTLAELRARGAELRRAGPERTERHAERWLAQQAAQARVGEQWSRPLPGVGMFTLPDGAMHPLPSSFGHVFSAAGEVFLLTSDPTYDPIIGSSAGWQRIESRQ